MLNTSRTSNYAGYAAILTGLFAVLPGCNAAPRHFDVVPSSTVHFVGYYPAANATIEVHADPDINNGVASDFALVGTLQTSSTPTFIDSNNASWYAYEGDVTIPESYWDVSAGPFDHANVRLYGGPNKAPVAVFDDDDATIQACIANNNFNGANVWANCRATSTGFAGDYTQDNPANYVGFMMTLRR